MTTRLPFLLALMLALLPAPAARADEVVKKDGTTIKGVVTRKTRSYVFVRTLSGVERLRRSEIEEIIENGVIGQEAIDQKVMTVDDTVPDELAGVASWAKKEGLRGWELLAEKVLVLDEDNDKAHELLGHFKGGDRWFEEKREAERYERRMRRREMREKGYVPYKDGFIKKDDRRDASRNIEDFILADDGIWYRKTEYYKSRGYVQFDGAWVKITPEDKAEMEAFEAEMGEKILFITGKHFRLGMMTYSAKELQEFSEFCERVYEWFLKQVGKEPGYDLFQGNRGRILVFKDKPTSMKWLDKFGVRYNLGDTFRKLMDMGSGNVHSGPALIGVTTLDKNKDIRNQLAHRVGHFCIHAFCKGLEGGPPSWLVEAWAHMAEHAHMGNGVVNCSTLAEYGAGGGVAEKRAFSTKEAPDIAKGLVRRGDHEPFVNLTKLKLNSLDSGHLSKGWTMLEWLMDDYRDKLIEWMLRMNVAKPIEALQKTFEWSPAELDELWRKHVRQAF